MLAFEPISIPIEAAAPVSGLLGVPPKPIACFVFAHGAGAGMAHSFMTEMAERLAERRIATLRFQFPSMERGSKRPDPPRVAHAAVRGALLEAARRLPGVALFAGGKSFGARMSSQAQAEGLLEGARGLVFVGFPLHPAGKPAIDRAAHLKDVSCEMLFLQGTRDELAELDLITAVAGELGSRATLRVFDDADHSFHVRVRSGRTDAQVHAELADAIEGWIADR